MRLTRRAPLSEAQDQRGEHHLRRTPRALLGICVLLLGCTALTGCDRTFPNSPLTRHAPNADLLKVRPKSGRTSILLSFSGGGVRASALAWAVLRELSEVDDGDGHKLTDDIRVISSASGGSVTAAIFGLKGIKGLELLESKFLRQNNMRSMELTALSPVTWAKLAGPSYSRIDVLREYLDQQLFEKATYRDLYSNPNAPFVYLNATDMVSGEVFTFDSLSFDNICSDLGSFSLANAVAASAAFPILLTPVSLKNYSGTADCAGAPAPPWVDRILNGRKTQPWTRFYDRPKYEMAERAQTFRSGSIKYLHLLDGGLTDNLGALQVVQELTSPLGTQLEPLFSGNVQNLVVIEVVARSHTSSGLSAHPSTPGIVSVFNSIVDNPISSATRSNSEILGQAVDIYRGFAMNPKPGAGQPHTPEHVYEIQIDPEEFNLFDDQERGLRDRFETIATSWSMTADDLEIIKLVAHRLLYEHPCFAHLHEDLSGAAPSPLGEKCA